MDDQLKGALERVGWNELYERWIPGLGRVNSKGERFARSPFPDVIDNDPSFSVNIYNGLWKCFKSDRGGNYVQFCALMQPVEYDENGKSIPDFDAAERDLLVEFGIANPINVEWINYCRDMLYRDLALQHKICNFKPWDFKVLYALGVGYDSETDRITMPVYDRRGKLVNARMYRPGGTPKMLWKVAHLGGNFLMPHQGYREQILILVEGEPDMYSLRSIGFSSVSGTLGAGTPVPPGDWWRNKTLYLWVDDDASGRDAEREAVRITRYLATSVRLVQWPDWPGKGEKADVSDYLLYLRNLGFDVEQRQRAVIELLNNSKEVPHPHAVFDAPAERKTFSDAMSSENLNRRIGFTARITARSERRFILPTVISVVCPAQGHRYCGQCPMHHDFHGNARLVHDPRRAETLKLIQGSERDQMDVYKSLLGIVKQCPDPIAVTQEAANVEPVILNSSIVEAEGEQGGSAERQRREALIIVPQGESIEENRDYDLEGFVYPAPRTQHGLFLVDRISPAVVSYEHFKVDPEIIQQLQIFQPRHQQSVIDKLCEVANDLSNSVTLIKSRQDLHLAYRTVWHSVLKFNFLGTTIDRGWLEALVIGDTRCGKSVAFRRMAEYYGLGLLVDCKMQTPAGILGSVVTSQSTGERYVLAGILPQQDGRVICFDEFHVPRWSGRQGLIEVLSSTRSEGVARISKAASAQYRARVRAIWLANPGMGRLMSELGISGAEVIGRLIQQPEDIARFDFALALSQDDVSVDTINEVREPDPPFYTPHLSRMLMSWTYSRRSDQVTFQRDAQEAVIALAKEMYHKYDATIPLVEPADQRTRVAKVAVSVAAQCFSTDATGEQLVVRSEHVHAARSLFFAWFDKPAMNYARYSQKIKEDRSIRDSAEVLKVLNETFAPHGKQFAESLLKLDEFTERTFGTIVPVPGLFVRNVIQTFYNNRCIRLVSHGRKESYELTPAFVKLLKDYIAQ